MRFMTHEQGREEIDDSRTFTIASAQLQTYEMHDAGFGSGNEQQSKKEDPFKSLTSILFIEKKLQKEQRKDM